MSSARRSRAWTSSSRSTAWRSWPSCPPAPVMRIRTLLGDGAAGQSPVITLVELPELLLLPASPPRLVGPVPVHGSSHPFAKRDGGFPSERADARDIKRVAVVVARPVLHEMLQRRWLGTELEHRVGHRHTGDFRAGTDVVGASWLPLRQDGGDRAHVIVDV